MKYLIIIFSLISLQAFSQCPDSVTCDSNSFTFHYSFISNVDTMYIAVGGVTYKLEVTNRTPTKLVTTKDSLDCSDYFSSIQYFRNGNSVGTPCASGGYLPLILDDAKEAIVKLNESKVLYRVIVNIWGQSATLNDPNHVILTKYLNGQITKVRIIK